MVRPTRIRPDLIDRRLLALNGLDPVRRHPMLTQATAEAIVPRLADAPHLEHLFRGRWCYQTERIVSAEWVATGAESQLALIPAEFEANEVALHNHPSLGLLVPSATDSNTAADLARRGVGFAVCSTDLEQALLLRPPRAPCKVSTMRVIHLGPLSLSYLTQRRFS